MLLELLSFLLLYNKNLLTSRYPSHSCHFLKKTLLTFSMAIRLFFNKSFSIKLSFQSSFSFNQLPGPKINFRFCYSSISFLIPKSVVSFNNFICITNTPQNLVYIYESAIWASSTDILCLCHSKPGSYSHLKLLN